LPESGHFFLDTASKSGAAAFAWPAYRLALRSCDSHRSMLYAPQLR